MSVARILKDKGREVLTIEAEKFMSDAVAMLSQNRVGAVVVTDPGGQVLGIVSERDVVRAVATGGRDGLADPVSAWMTHKVATCSNTATVVELMTMMTDGKFRHVPVIEAGRLDGLVSIGDIVKHRLAEMEAESKALRDYIATA